jgi:hypothetical protein
MNKIDEFVAFVLKNRLEIGFIIGSETGDVKELTHNIKPQNYVKIESNDNDGYDIYVINDFVLKELKFNLNAYIITGLTLYGDVYVYKQQNGGE